MEYRWDDFCLDREGTLLTRHGQQVDVTRRVLDCMSYLIGQRHRVVGYDELIRKIWGHDNVTNHQLTQVVVAARRAIGDNGKSQRLIRNLPRLGYRWVYPVREMAEAPATFEQQAVELASPGEAEIPTPTPERQFSLETARLPKPAKVGFVAKSVLVLALMTVIVSGWWFHKPPPTEIVSTPPMAPKNQLASLEQAFWRGDYEYVRSGIAALPNDLAGSADAGMLEIRLDIERGRFDLAAEKLAHIQTRMAPAADTLLQAKLLTLQSYIGSRAAKPASETLPPAQRAVALLETLGNQAPKLAMGEALAVRGSGFMIDGQSELAMRDLIHALDILQVSREKHLVVKTRRMLAQVWLRMGRLADAMQQLNQIIEISAQSMDANEEALALNSKARVQIELIDWDNALASSQRSMLLSKNLLDPVRRVASMRLRALVLTQMGHLREAESLIEEADSVFGQQQATFASALYALEAGNPKNALRDSAAMFVEFGDVDKPNLILQNKEGALLLWMMAAQHLTTYGQSMPKPSAAQLAALQRPESIPGGIARGRWLWSKGMRSEAEVQLRMSFDQAWMSGRLFYMTLAAEPLISLLLEKKDIKAAEIVLATLRGIRPELMDRDYRVNVLRLRVALAKDNIAEVQEARRRVLGLAGERSLPKRAVEDYARLIASKGGILHRKLAQETGVEMNLTMAKTTR